MAHRLLNPDSLNKASDTTQVVHLFGRAEHWVVVSDRARVTRGEDDIERFEDRYNRA